MHPKNLRLPAALALALGASSAHALGLGAIEVKSGYDQPLLAEIPVVLATPTEGDQLQVRLAPREAFARVGLELPASLAANLQFAYTTNARGQPIIRVTTPNRVNDPYVSFLLEVDWGRGRLVREFTVLLDPPYIAPAVLQPVQPVTAAAPATTCTAAPRPPLPPT